MPAGRRKKVARRAKKSSSGDASPIQTDWLENGQNGACGDPGGVIGRPPAPECRHGAANGQKRSPKRPPQTVKPAEMGVMGSAGTGSDIGGPDWTPPRYPPSGRRTHPAELKISEYADHFHVDVFVRDHIVLSTSIKKDELVADKLVQCLFGYRTTYDLFMKG